MHGIIHSVSSSYINSYIITTPRKQNPCDVMPLYRRACTKNLSLHLIVMFALLPHVLYTYSLFLWVKENACKTTMMVPFCYRRCVYPSTRARNNASFTLLCLILLSVSNVMTWSFILLLCAGDIQPNPGPLSVSSSSDQSSSSNASNDIFSQLTLNHHLSFVQYNVESIINKLDIIQTELFEIDILSFTETWLNPEIPTEDLVLQSYNTPERKDRPGEPGGGVMIYVKNGIYYKRRNDLEIRGVECIWIELIHNRKSILFGLFYRPPEANSQYFSNLEDSIALAIDTTISDIIITGDFNFNCLNPQAKRKIDMLCTQFSLHQAIKQPTHYTERSSSLIDIILVNNKDSLIFSGVGDFLEPSAAISLPCLWNPEICEAKN